MNRIFQIAFLLLFAATSHAASIITNPVFHVDDDDGNPLSGGCVYTYACGTTTKDALCANRACSSSAANPFTLDTRGEAATTITRWIL